MRFTFERYPHTIWWVIALRVFGFGKYRRPTVPNFFGDFLAHVIADIGQCDNSRTLIDETN